jgi:NTP pyrophosphatase (non-canonical NTP hydrolase)
MTGQERDRRLSAVEFERFATASDRLGNDMDTALLGLVGEVGSLVSALKKKRRDTDGFPGYHDAVLEELGDVLWYVSAVARRGGTSLSEALSRAANPTSNAETTTLGDLARSSTARSDEGAFERALLELAGEAGDLAKRFVGAAYRDNVDALRGDLVKFLRPLGEAAAAAEVSLDDAGRKNIAKTQDRWPAEQRFPPLFDEGLHVDEQLPRLLRVEIYEREVNGKKFVFQKSGGILLGDRLTDNHLPEDDYRFHDVFHLAYAAVLGWSPTTRALLKIKRKSRPEIDENEDGCARQSYRRGTGYLDIRDGEATTVLCKYTAARLGSSQVRERLRARLRSRTAASLAMGASHPSGLCRFSPAAGAPSGNSHRRSYPAGDPV